MRAARSNITAALIGGLVAGCGGQESQTTLSPPWPSSEQRAVTAPVPIGATTATSSRTGKLARRLPMRTRSGWRLYLASTDPAHGRYLVTVIPPAGRRTTPRSARQALRHAAAALRDNTGGYRAIVPMSALRGARPTQHLRGKVR